MKALFASSTAGLVGLIIFFTFFMGVLVWLFWPGSKDKFKKHGEIPLKDDYNEQ